jgi:sulfoxide reductase catalytic subunit YedY
MDKIRSSEITDRKIFFSRREFLGAAATLAGTVALGPGAAAQEPAPHGRRLQTIKSLLSTSETPNTWEHVTTYNNFYEFDSGAGGGPAKLARRFGPVEPWTVTIEGECEKPGKLNLEDVIKGETLEDRIYRHRCVEAWSMVIPWVGFPLANFIKRCRPTAKARFVEFTTLYDPRRFPGQSNPVLDWPYVEGLRLDEAMHPLTILGVGVYGEVLPVQNGAPLRLVVPWKYGFKSIKSIVKVKFVEKAPINSWQRAYPQAYGFYANVNPAVDHPNWSQAVERRLPSLFKSTKTLLFNGYGDQVAGLYAGMDLRRNY